jgi:phosphatidylinositol glycan class W
MSNEDEVRDASNPNPDPNNTNPSRSRKDVQYVSNFRGALVLMTCLSILFVDFTVFPRYHAKTELSGVSLMDVGIGGFVFSSGLTSRFARGLSPAGSTPRNTLRVVVVAALGVGRFVCLRAFDYHEHTSEYGVHWNFFVTLAAVWLSADTLHSLVRPDLVPAIALAMLMGYQCVLAGTDLAEVVFHSPRDNLVRANREGIVSLVGFTALYLLAESIAHKFIFREGLGPAVDPPVRMLAVLTVCSMVLFALTCTLTAAPVSRRLTNPAYILAVLAICLSILLAFSTVDWALEPRCGRKHGSGSGLELAQGTQALLLSAFSRNQLLLFLAANLMTGAVNVCVQTIYMEDTPALALLGIYTGTLCVCAHSFPRSLL